MTGAETRSAEGCSRARRKSPGRNSRHAVVWAGTRSWKGWKHHRPHQRQHQWPPSQCTSSSPSTACSRARWTSTTGSTRRWARPSATITDAANTILLGPHDVRDVRAGLVDRTVEEDPGAPFFNETQKYVVGAQEPEEEWRPPPASARTTPTRSAAQGRAGRASSTSPAAASWSGAAQGGPGRQPAPVRLPDRPRRRRAPLEGRRRPDQARAEGTDVYDNGVVHLDYGPA